MANIRFIDHTEEVKALIVELAESSLEEVCGELESQVKRNQSKYRDSGDTTNSWQHKVMRSGEDYIGIVGSDHENAIWEEFGTGEHALNKDGRKGYWVFVAGGDGGSTSKSKKSYTLKQAKRIVAIMRKKGLNAYYTSGKKPRRHFQKAYDKNKNKMIKFIQDRFKGGLS